MRNTNKTATHGEQDYAEDLARHDFGYASFQDCDKETQDSISKKVAAYLPKPYRAIATQEGKMTIYRAEAQGNGYYSVFKINAARDAYMHYAGYHTIGRTKKARRAQLAEFLFATVEDILFV
jgi:hypothetical protein